MGAAAPRSIGHYTAEEVARLAGVSPRRIGQWARAGIIPSSGPGERVYSYADAGEAILAHYLVEQKLKPGEVRKIVENLRQEYGEWPLATAPLEHDAKLVLLRKTDGVHVDVVHRAEQEVIEGTLFELKTVRNALAHGGWVALHHRRPNIEVDPDRFSGRPTIRGLRIGTDIVAELASTKRGRLLLRDDYELTREQIADAVEYERAVSEAVAA